MTSTNHSDAIDRLMQLGDCRKFKPWPDYLGLGLTEADIPELIRIATARDLLSAEGNKAAFWAPIHAWQALGALGAAAAVEPLIEMFDEGDRSDGIRDWIEDAMPEAFETIGPSAVPALTAYLQDESRDSRARLVAISCLERIGAKYRAERAACTAAIVSQLDKFPQNDRALNGFLVSSLIDLDESDALPLIERVYNSGCIDVSICGDFQEVRKEFGLTPASGLFDAL